MIESERIGSGLWSDRYDLPWLSLAAAGLVTLISFIAAAIAFSDVVGSGEATADRISSAQMLAGEIGRLDEVLTMSARMAAQSGDLQWEVRYRRNVPALDRALDGILAFVPPADAQRFDKTTKLANDRLVTLEKASFDAVRQGRLGQAKQFMSGTSYTANKRLYVAGLKGLVAASRVDLRTRKQHTKSLKNTALITVLFAGLLIGALWLHLGFVLWRWRCRLTTAALERETFVRLGAEREAADLKRAQMELVERAELNRRAADDQRMLVMRARQREAILQMADRFEASVGEVAETLSRTASDLESAAAQLAPAAEQTNRRAAAVAAASSIAAANVQSVAMAGDEMVASIKEIDRQAVSTTEAARDAVKNVQNTDGLIKQLASRAEQIGRMVVLIEAIATKANLLALNATIEASRAGDAGRGFIVVATEIKALAAQTAEANKEIASQVAGVREAVETSVTALRSISQSVGEIDAVALAIALAIDRHALASQEVSHNVQAAARATEAVSVSIAGVNDTASDAGSAAARVLRSSSDMASRTELLRNQVAGFLVTVRADPQAELPHMIS